MCCIFLLTFEADVAFPTLHWQAPTSLSVVIPASAGVPDFAVWTALALLNGGAIPSDSIVTRLPSENCRSLSLFKFPFTVLF